MCISVLFKPGTIRLFLVHVVTAVTCSRCAFVYLYVYNKSIFVSTVCICFVCAVTLQGFLMPWTPQLRTPLGFLAWEASGSGWNQNFVQTMNSEKTPHTSHLLESYGVSVALEKRHRKVWKVHCTTTPPCWQLHTSVCNKQEGFHMRDWSGKSLRSCNKTLWCEFHHYVFFVVVVHSFVNIYAHNQNILLPSQLLDIYIRFRDQFWDFSGKSLRSCWLLQQDPLMWISSSCLSSLVFKPTYAHNQSAFLPSQALGIYIWFSLSGFDYHLHQLMPRTWRHAAVTFSTGSGRPGLVVCPWLRFVRTRPWTGVLLRTLVVVRGTFLSTLGAWGRVGLRGGILAGGSTLFIFNKVKHSFFACYICLLIAFWKEPL